MTIYEVELSWFDCETETSERVNEHYFFTNAEDALRLGKNLAQCSSVYESYEYPICAYLFSFEEGDAVTIDRQYDAAWLDLDKKVRF